MEKMYVVINEGDVVYATTSEEEAIDTRDQLIAEHIADEVENAGRDLDDLTEEEYNQFAFSSGYNGGHHYTAEVNVSREDLDMEITTDEGDTITAADVYEAYDNASVDISDITDEILDDLQVPDFVDPDDEDIDGWGEDEVDDDFDFDSLDDFLEDDDDFAADDGDFGSFENFGEDSNAFDSDK